MQKAFLTYCGYFSDVLCADNGGSEWTKDPQMPLSLEIVFAKTIGQPFELLQNFLMK